MADVPGWHDLIILHQFVLPPYWKELCRKAVGLMLFKEHRLVFTILMHLPTTVVSGCKGLVQHQHPGLHG